MVLQLLVSLAVAAELPGLTPLASLDLDTPDATLAPIAEVVGDATFVGLGESKHSAGGYLEAKARLVQWLVEVHGFRVVALESPWVWARTAQGYVATGEGTAEAAMSSIFPAFRDSSTLEMFRWLRAWNDAHPDDPVHFIGFDVQDPPHLLEALIAEADPPWSALAQDTLAVGQALQHDRETASGAYSQIRDEGMADTLLALRGEFAPDARTIVLAHNAHLMRRGSETHFRDTGEHLAERFGDDYVAIGLVGLQVDSLGQGWTTHDRRGALEPELAEALDTPAALLELSDPRWEEDGRLGGFDLRPGEQYDAVLYQDHVRAGDAVPDRAPWGGAQGLGYLPDHRLRILHRTEHTDAERERLWTHYAEWLGSVGYASSSKRRRRRQSFEADGLADAELQVRWASEDAWHVELTVEPVWRTRL